MKSTPPPKIQLKPHQAFRIQQMFKVAKRSAFSQKELDCMLVHAARIGHVQLLHLLLKVGADATAYKSQALQSALVPQHNKNVISILLLSGADPDLLTAREREMFGAALPFF